MRRLVLALSLLLLLGLLGIGGVEAIPNILDSFPFETGQGTLGMGTNVTNVFVQSWKNTAPSVSIISATFWLYRQGNPTGNLHVVLYRGTTSEFATSSPIEPALTNSQPLDMTTLTETVTERIFDFSGQTQLSETLYFIGLRFDQNAVLSAGNTAVVSWDTTSPTHPGHVYVKLAGTWTEYTDRDFHFIVRGETGSGVGGQNQPTGEPLTDQPSLLPAVAGGSTTIVLVGIIAYFLFLKKGRSRIL